MKKETRIIIKDPLYKQIFVEERHKKFMAHDEQNQAKAGDLVIVRECRPRSAKKRFMLDKIVEKAQAGFEETDATADVPVEEEVPKEVPKPPKPKNVKAEKESK